MVIVALAAFGILAPTTLVSLKAADIHHADDSLWPAIAGGFIVLFAAGALAIVLATRIVEDRWIAASMMGTRILAERLPSASDLYVVPGPTASWLRVVAPADIAGGLRASRSGWWRSPPGEPRALEQCRESLRDSLGTAARAAATRIGDFARWPSMLSGMLSRRATHAGDSRGRLTRATRPVVPGAQGPSGGTRFGVEAVVVMAMSMRAAGSVAVTTFVSNTVSRKAIVAASSASAPL